MNTSVHSSPNRLSIIVPVYNDSKNLSECLSALKASAISGSEIIVVDDASTDETPFIAEEMGVRVLRLEKNSGVAAARNYGASHARGEILFFVDSDVIVAPDAVHRVMKVFEERPNLAAVFGSYDTQPRAKGVVSQYRNLLHHFVHQNGSPKASTFWGACGAVRCSVFKEVGGFDAKRYRKPSIEDIELGYRLRQAGYEILLDKELQGTHLKCWNLYSVVRTDITCRAIPWSRLLLERKDVPNDLNLKWEQQLSVALVGLACMLLFLSALKIELLAMSAAALLGPVVLNRRLYAFFHHQRGFFFAIICMPLHFLYYLYSGFCYLYVRLEFQLRSAPTDLPNE